MITPISERLVQDHQIRLVCRISKLSVSVPLDVVTIVSVSTLKIAAVHYGALEISTFMLF